MAKALHSGLAARAGIEATTLARRGFTADPAIIEAPLGFLQAVVDPADCDVTTITERLGRPYVLEGLLRIKRFPACNPGHPLIDATLRLVRDYKVHPEEVVSIDADLHVFSLLRPQPADEEGAGFSGAFLIAATLLHGRFTLDELTDKAVHDPRIKSLMARIRHTPAAAQETMRVTLRDGRTVAVEVRPVSRLSARDDIRAKFRQCAAAILAPPDIERLEDMILTLDRQPDLARLMETAGAASRQPAETLHARR
jgi:2-methylcitrate dehydratase PrpD